MYKITISFIICYGWFCCFLYAQLAIDKQQYQYTFNNNQLNRIREVVRTNISTMDIDNQRQNNYAYNLNGQLIKEEAEGIIEIQWNISGKIKQVKIDDSKPKDGIADRVLQFKYDALGNRIKKIETIIRNNKSNTTYYVRNATGELISTYIENENGLHREELCITEGVNQVEENISENRIFTRTTGTKHYQIKDHLGSVRATIGDNKTLNDEIYNVELFSNSDYFSYGSPLFGRSYNRSHCQYGYQGKIKDDELKGTGNSYDFGARMLDPRVGRWLSTDPLAEQFPNISPYNSMGNNPINKIDPNGKEDLHFNSKQMVQNFKIWLNQKKIQTFQYLEAVRYEYVYNINSVQDIYHLAESKGLSKLAMNQLLSFGKSNQTSITHQMNNPVSVTSVSSLSSSATYGLNYGGYIMFSLSDSHSKTSSSLSMVGFANYQTIMGLNFKNSIRFTHQLGDPHSYLSILSSAKYTGSQSLDVASFSEVSYSGLTSLTTNFFINNKIRLQSSTLAFYTSASSESFSLSNQTNIEFTNGKMSSTSKARWNTQSFLSENFSLGFLPFDWGDYLEEQWYDYHFEAKLLMESQNSSKAEFNVY